MNYDMTKPCPDCPFLKKNRGYKPSRLKEFASGEFHCHKTGTLREEDDDHDGYVPTEESSHCAGALIYLTKRNQPHQMMRICERLGMFDPSKLDMTAEVK